MAIFYHNLSQKIPSISDVLGLVQFGACSSVSCVICSERLLYQTSFYTSVANTILQHFYTTLFFNTSLPHSSPAVLYHSLLQRFSTTLLLQLSSPTLLYNASPPTLFANTSLQPFAPTFFSNTPEQHFPTTLLYNTLLQHFSTTHLSNTLLQHFSTTLFYNTLLQHLSSN